MDVEELKGVISSQQSYQTLQDDSDATQSQDNTPVEDISCCTKVKNVLFRCGTYYKSLKIEVLAFFVIFSYNMTGITSTTLIIDKACLVHFEYPRNICSNLDSDNYTDIKTSVEKLATNYQLCHSLIQAVPAAILANFIGPWSDHYGRRFPILLAALGMLLDSAGSAICAYFLYSRIEYFFIPAIFSGVCGGKVTIMAVVMSYASDITPIEGRTVKYAFLGMYIGLATAAGSTSGGWIYNFLSYPAVYICSAVVFGLAILWVIFKLPETREMDSEDKWSEKLKNLCSCDTLKESWIALTKERPHRGKIQVLLLIVSVITIVIANYGTDDIDYLFVHHQFGWSNTKFSTVKSVYTAIGILMYIIVLPTLKYFKAGDPVLGLIGTTSTLALNVGIAIAYKSGIYHLANIAGLLNYCALLACQSRISKLVCNEDLGKIFSFVSTAESLSPILASVMLAQIFRSSLDFFPGMSYAVVALFLVLPMAVFIWMTRLQKLTWAEIKASRPDENFSSSEGK
ncbi:solute carrier family 46 member 3-like [Uloborus diversus]|uniref:solute carrier family 46 member 3-like n=1 Tax=Uloborus diversus TaxID=327109 RepID=UPI0024096FE8|nr:solute carrier family 46 member 3-like [Uloborus diversus]